MLQLLYIFFKISWSCFTVLGFKKTIYIFIASSFVFLYSGSWKFLYFLHFRVVFFAWYSALLKVMHLLPQPQRSDAFKTCWIIVSFLAGCPDLQCDASSCIGKELALDDQGCTTCNCVESCPPQMVSASLHDSAIRRIM